MRENENKNILSHNLLLKICEINTLKKKDSSNFFNSVGEGIFIDYHCFIQIMNEAW